MSHVTQDEASAPRLFHCSNASGAFETEELFDFSQDDLQVRVAVRVAVCVECVLQYVAVCCGMLRCVVVCYSVLQCGAVCCSVLDQLFGLLQDDLQVLVAVCVALCVAVCCSVPQGVGSALSLQHRWMMYTYPTRIILQHTATHCNTMQNTATQMDDVYILDTSHTATPYNTLRHTATCCNMLQHRWMMYTSSTRNTLQLTLTHCNTLHHTATLCNTDE